MFSPQESSYEFATPSGLIDNLADINSVFKYDSIEGIQAALEPLQTPWAEAAKQMLQK